MSEKLEDFLSSVTLESFLPKGRPIVKVEYTEYVPELLQKLSDANVHAAVVVDSDPKVGVIGFVDVLDILCYVIDVTNESTTDITKESTQNIKWEAKCFQNMSSGSISNLSQKDPMFTISEKSSIMDAIRMLSKGVHRLAVIDPNASHSNRIVNVMSLSDIVTFIMANKTRFAHLLDKTINELGLQPIGVATVLDSLPTIDALKYLQDLKVSGLGIVNQSGQIVGNLSATDLLGLTEENFKYLGIPVYDFIRSMKGFNRYTVCCDSNEKFSSLIKKFHDYAVHRVYMVDSNNVPNGILTLTDLVQYLSYMESYDRK